MPISIWRIYQKPDGGVTRTSVETHASGDPAALLKKHLEKYPEQGQDKDAYWARDAEGKRYTFNVLSP
jgi:hypothetical protein